MYTFNRQVSKYRVMAFFLSKINILSLLITGYEFVLPCIAMLCAFSIARPLNARLHSAGF